MKRTRAGGVMAMWLALGASLLALGFGCTQAPGKDGDDRPAEQGGNGEGGNGEPIGGQGGAKSPPQVKPSDMEITLQGESAMQVEAAAEGPGLWRVDEGDAKAVYIEAPNARTTTVHFARTGTYVLVYEASQDNTETLRVIVSGPEHGLGAMVKDGAQPANSGSVQLIWARNGAVVDEASLAGDANEVRFENLVAPLHTLRLRITP